MQLTDWGAPVSAGEAARRAGGRRRYNAWRTFRREYRLLQVARLLRRGTYGGLIDRGTQTRLARALGVSRSTVCRDIAALLAASNARRGA